MIEIWKDILDYEGLYQISNFGNVKALERYINICSKRALLKEKFLKFDASNLGYQRVTLSKNGKTKRFLVHRLVALHFLDKVEGKDIVNHLDNNPSNNHVSNLEWCTHQENMLHAQKQNRLFNSQSKGGKASAVVGLQKALQKYSDEFGNIYGNILIKSLTDKRAKNNKMLLEVQCLNCGTISLKPLDYLKIRKPKKCYNCR